MESDTAQLQAWKTGRSTRFRAQKAYVLTVRILAGYLWLRIWKPVLGPSLYNRRLVERHRRNSKRITRAILELGGLFIKVGQLVRIRGMEEYPDDIAQMIRDELDFRQEARNIETFTRSFVGNGDVHFPVVVQERSSQRVLTTEFVEGIKVTDFAELEARGIDRPILAKRILRTVCQMVFVDGVFHADPHPGNIVVHLDGTFTMVDLGAVGRLAPGVKEGVPVFWQGVILRDPAMISAGLRQSGLISRDQDDEEVADRAIDYFQRRFLEQMHVESWSLTHVQVDMRTRVDALLDLRKLDISFRDLSRAFTVPKEWVLFERASILMLGLCTEVDPNMNPSHTVGPYLHQFVLGKHAGGKSQATNP